MYDNDYMSEAWDRLLAAIKKNQVRNNFELRTAALTCVRMEARMRRYLNVQEKEMQVLAALFEENSL